MQVRSPRVASLGPRVQLEYRAALRAHLHPDGRSHLDRSGMRGSDGEQEQLGPRFPVDGRELKPKLGDIGEHLAHDPRVVIIVDDHDLTRANLVREGTDRSFQSGYKSFELVESTHYLVLAALVLLHRSPFGSRLGRLVRPNRPRTTNAQHDRSTPVDHLDCYPDHVTRRLPPNRGGRGHSAAG